MKRVVYYLLLVGWLGITAIGVNPSTVYSAEVVDGFDAGDVAAGQIYWMDVTDDSGKDLLYKTSYTFENFRIKDNKYYRLTRVYYNQKNNYQLNEESIMKANLNQFAPVFSLRVELNAEKKEVRREELAFYPNKSEVRVVRKYDDPTKQSDDGYTESFDKVIKDVPANSYTKGMFEIGFQGANIDKDFYKKKIYVISRNGMNWAMEIKAEKLVEVEVPAGKFACYEVRQSAHPFSALAAVAPRTLMPSAMLWYSTTKPHTLIQYHGYWDAPVSLTDSIAEINKGKSWNKLVKVEPADVTKIISKDELLERMKFYGLLPE